MHTTRWWLVVSLVGGLTLPAAVGSAEESTWRHADRATDTQDASDVAPAPPAMPSAVSAPELTTLDLPPHIASDASAIPSAPHPATAPMAVVAPAEAKPSPSSPEEAARQAALDYYADVEANQGGALKVADMAAGQTRTLQLERMHDDVTKSGNQYVVGADMHDTANGDQVGVEFNVANDHGKWSVAEVRIPQVNGKSR